MKTRTRNIENSIAVILILFLYGLTTNLVAQEEEIITGTVKANKWNDAEEVISAVLEVVTEDEDDEGKIITYLEEYSIEDNTVGRRLIQLDGETVEVVCKIIENDDGSIYLKVKSFNIIELEEEEPEADEPDEPLNKQLIYQ